MTRCMLIGRCPRRQVKRTGTTGTIETPGYPQPYRKKQICLWRIRVPKGSRQILHL